MNGHTTHKLSSSDWGREWGCAFLRQTERMQMGLVLAAVMLCFTAMVPTSKHKHVQAEVVASEATGRLAAVCHISASSDRTVQFFVASTDAGPPVTVLRRGEDPRFFTITAAIDDAVRVQGVPKAQKLDMILYARDGHPDYRLNVTEDGRLFDPNTKLLFQPNDAFEAFVEPWTHRNSVTQMP